MDWIFDNFQFVVLIAVVIGSLVKRILEAKVAGKQAGDEMPDEGDIFDPEDVWAPPQGQPMPSVPPPLVRQVPPPLMRETVPPPQHSREYEMEVILKRQQDMQERLRQAKESKTTTTGGASATRARVAASQSNATKASQPAKSSLRGALRNPKEIRRAVIMREILGPPVGLR
jgi:hypothetical protein